MVSSGGCTHLPSIPALVLDLRFVSALSSDGAVEFGWNLSSDEERPSSSRFQTGASAERERASVLPHVLVIEDNPADVALVRESLDEHKLRCELTVISDGEKALSYFEQMDARKTGCPSLVLLDLNLPKRNGLEVLTRLRASGYCPNTPVVVLSSSDAFEDKSAAFRLGARLYIRKPTSLEDFLQIGGLLKDILAERHG